jgi:outer membrane autotransporter protein
VDSYILAGYAGGSLGPFALRSGGAWTWHNVSTSRSVIFPGFFEAESATYDADTGQLFGEAAYPLLLHHAAVEPFADLAYVHVGTGSFTESGALAALTASGNNEDVGYSLLGVRAATTFPVADIMVTPHGSVAWQYAFGDITPAQTFAFASTGIAFGISGVAIAQNSALIDAGLDIVIGPDATLGLSYAGQLAGNLQDNGIQGRINWRF